MNPWGFMRVRLAALWASIRETYEYPAPRAVRRNAYLNLLEGALFSLTPGVIGPFFGVYLLELNGTHLMVGLASALPFLVAGLVQLWAVGIAERRGHRQTAITMSLFARSGYVLMALAPILPLPAQLRCSRDGCA